MGIINLYGEWRGAPVTYTPLSQKEEVSIPVQDFYPAPSQKKSTLIVQNVHLWKNELI